MQVFEVEDPEGPLDTPSEDIGQQFGRLQLKNAAELGLPAEQLSELAAAQGDTPPPTLEQDLELWKRHVGLQQGNGEILHQAYSKLQPPQLRSSGQSGESPYAQ